MGKIRGTHSSPGIYDKITDLFYAANTMGITSLALVGETIKGPAFEPIKVTKWTEYTNRFGGTSAKKFKDSQYPKYELPYIAKSYLKASEQLYVCRVLGLSGYNAGPAFVITAESNTGTKHVVAVLRSRAKYTKTSPNGACGASSDVEQLVFDCDTVELSGYTGGVLSYNCSGNSINGSTSVNVNNIQINSTNYGKFTIVCKKGTETKSYPVSLNSGDKDYIYNVLGGSAEEGSAPVYVEEFYDVMLADAYESGQVSKISSAVTTFAVENFAKIVDSSLNEIKVLDVVESNTEAALTKKDLGKVFLEQITSGSSTTYKVVKVELNQSGVCKYVAVKQSGNTDAVLPQVAESATTKTVIYVENYGSYVYNNSGVITTASDFSDYREMFRYASTPWIVSELKGDSKNIELKKLFRFHTITDGNFANQEVKVSIANIKPDEGTFDVYVRDFNDSDINPMILESFRNLTMVPGDSRYIGYKIGTIDGAYESKSNYITVEIVENDMTAQCVPAGFLGYPVRYYGANIKAPYLKFNTEYNDELKEKRQYFGISDIVGIDVDMFNYKGRAAYQNGNISGYTKAFHLDSSLNAIPGAKITVDGKEGFVFDTVSYKNTLEGSKKIPVIGSEGAMADTIFENVKLRKFTVCFYGGFDGWDIYRGSRTNTDEYKASKYKGKVGFPGDKTVFSKVTADAGLALDFKAISSDYYAYLAGVNAFSNPERYVINLFATPGIDYVNNRLLVEDTLEVIESRKDTLYIPTTPDKPWGASDNASEMFTAEDAAANLEDAGIDTYYAATYYPWVKYEDTQNNIYINLPATKDVLRNMADVDDKRFPWIAPAGMERGKVDCKKLHVSSTIEDRDNAYDGRINPLIDYSKEGVRVWGNKTMYVCEETNPMNRINTVRLLLYMRKLINEASRNLIFDPNDDTLADEFYGIIEPILKQIKKDRGITDFKLNVSQTKEQMDLHEMSCTIFIKPTPTLEYIEINYVVTPQGISFEDIKLAA